jgi:hypothetical protein
MSPQREIMTAMTKNQSEPKLAQSTKFTYWGSSRPKSSLLTKMKIPLKRTVKNDPVSRYQQMSQTWNRDKFLSGGANKKEGRKLELDRRNR